MMTPGYLTVIETYLEYDFLVLIPRKHVGVFDLSFALGSGSQQKYLCPPQLQSASSSSLAPLRAQP